MKTYEQLLNRNPSWALLQGSLHFEKANAVHDTLRKIVAKLQSLQVRYAIVGAIAMFFHGYRRFTEDVDILIAPEGWRSLVGSLHDHEFILDENTSVRDAATGVRIDFLLTDQWTNGGGQVVSFTPNEEQCCQVDGITFLRLQRVLEMKLLSGMTRRSRLRDLADAQAMLETLQLPRDFANQLHPSVQSKYRELWDVVQNNPGDP